MDFTLRVDVFHHAPDTAKLDVIIAALGALSRTLTQQGAVIMQEVDSAIDRVRNLENVGDGVAELLRTNSALLRDAISQIGGSAEDKAKLSAIANEMDNKAQTWAQAVVENTVAAQSGAGTTTAPTGTTGSGPLGTTVPSTGGVSVTDVGGAPTAR